MQISTPLLYSAYSEPDHSGPLLKIKLLPLRKLTKTPVMQHAANLRMLRYITIATAVLIVTSVAAFIMLA